jgi:competence protein ComEC
MDTNTKNGLKLLILPLILATAIVWYYVHQVQPDYLMRVNFLEIGQGDSILVTTYQGNQLLIDGGPGSNVLQDLGKHMPFQDRSIEMMILTHPHTDHFEGLIQVLKHYQVKKIMLPNVDYSSPPYEEFKRAMQDEGAEIIYAVQGQRVWLDKATVFDVMWPKHKDAFKPPKNYDLNDESVVGMLIFGRTKILLTGDSGFEIENELLPMFNLDADVLKVGHHGSKTSTSAEFLAEVTPQYSVIQSGQGNRYGHPNQEVLDRLKKANSKILRLDSEQDIEFSSDGSKFQRH